MMAQQCSAPWFLPSVGLLLPASRGGIPESDPRDDVAGTWDKKRYSIWVAGEEWVELPMVQLGPDSLVPLPGLSRNAHLG